MEVVRHKHLAVLESLIDKNFIKVITGIRRCGKSTLMLQFQDRLKEINPDANILSYSLDAAEFRFLAERSWKEMYDFISASLVAGKMNYVFLDEIQNVSEFEKLLEGLFVNPDIDLYVTGSNAYLLSSELATLLTGRAFEINLLPFSFLEYMEAMDFPSNTEREFSNYLNTGGFPEAVNFAKTNKNFAYQYIKTVFENIYNNDILKRNSIQSFDAYKELVNFLIDSVGSIVSANNIAKTLTANGVKIDNKSVSKYINTLVESFLFYKVNRFDVKGKQHLSTQEKYYLVDMGLRNALLGKELDSDYGHLLENAVYLELLRRDNQVWIGKVDNKEVDFVCRTAAGYTVYYQVAYTVKDKQTLERELAPLIRIKDHNEKILLTMDYETGSRDGIKQVNAIDWFLENNNV